MLGAATITENALMTVRNGADKSATNPGRDSEEFRDTIEQLFL
jgi:hypothetical protein